VFDNRWEASKWRIQFFFFFVWHLDSIPRMSSPYGSSRWHSLDTPARGRELYLTTRNTHKRQTSIRTRNSSNRTAADPRLKPHDHWNRRVFRIKILMILIGMFLADHGLSLPKTVTFLFCFWMCPLWISGYAAEIVWGNSLQAGRSRFRFPMVSL
jgi:hypothetical protein